MPYPPSNPMDCDLLGAVAMSLKESLPPIEARDRLRWSYVCRSWYEVFYPKSFHKPIVHRSRAELLLFAGTLWGSGWIGGLRWIDRVSVHGLMDAMFDPASSLLQAFILRYHPDDDVARDAVQHKGNASTNSVPPSPWAIRQIIDNMRHMPFCRRQMVLDAMITDTAQMRRDFLPGGCVAVPYQGSMTIIAMMAFALSVVDTTSHHAYLLTYPSMSGTPPTLRATRMIALVLDGFRARRTACIHRPDANAISFIYDQVQLAPGDHPISFVTSQVNYRDHPDTVFRV